MRIYHHTPEEVRQVSKADVPITLQEHLIPGATYYLNEGDFGIVLSMEVKDINFSIWQHYFFIEIPCDLMVDVSEPITAFNYVLRGNHRGIFNEKNMVTWEEGTCQLVYAPTRIYPIFMERGQVQVIHIDLRNTFVKQLADADDKMKQLQATVQQNKGLGIRHDAGTIDIDTKMILLDIISYKYTGSKARLFFQLKIRELILAYIETHGITSSNPDPPQKHVDQILQITQYIQNNLHQRDLNLLSVAKEYNMAPATLKRVFKLYKGKPVSAFIRECRLYKSRELLTLGKYTINEIAEMVGYKDHPSFTHAFTKKFKHPPTYYLKFICFF